MLSFRIFLSFYAPHHTATAELQALFAHIKNEDDIRVVKVSIIDGLLPCFLAPQPKQSHNSLSLAPEQLAANGTRPTKGTWEQDIRHLIVCFRRCFTLGMLVSLTVSCEVALQPMIDLSVHFTFLDARID